MKNTKLVSAVFLLHFYFIAVTTTNPSISYTLHTHHHSKVEAFEKREDGDAYSSLFCLSDVKFSVPIYHINAYINKTTKATIGKVISFFFL